MIQCERPHCTAPAAVLDTKGKAACGACALASMLKQDPSIQLIIDKRKAVTA